MTSSPPEELSSFFISAAAWLSPGQQPATRGEGTSACLRIRDRLAHDPSVSPSDWTPHVTAPLPPCYSGENAGIWYAALFVAYWSGRQRGLRLMHCRHNLQQEISVFVTSCSQHTHTHTLQQEICHIFNLYFNLLKWLIIDWSIKITEGGRSAFLCWCKHKLLTIIP